MDVDIEHRIKEIINREWAPNRQALGLKGLITIAAKVAHDTGIVILAELMAEIEELKSRLDQMGDLLIAAELDVSFELSVPPDLELDHQPSDPGAMPEA